MHFRHIFSDAEKFRHWTKRHTHVIHVQTSNDYAHSSTGQLIAYFHNPFVKKLSFINGYYHFIGHHRENGRRVRYRHGGQARSFVTDDILFMVTVIDHWLKKHHFLVRDNRTIEAANQLFCFARKHGSTNHFNPPVLSSLARKLL